MTEPQLLPIPLGTGIDESFDDAFTPPNVARICQNRVFPGNDVAARRKGIVTTGAIFNYGKRLFARGSEVLATDGVNALSVTSDRTVGRVSPCMVRRHLLASANWNYGTSASHTYAGLPLPPLISIAEDPTTKLQVRAWNDGRAVGVKVVDPSDESVVASAALNNTAGNFKNAPISQPRVVIIASVAFVLYWDQASATKLRYQALDLTNPSGAWTAASDVTGITMSTTALWDAAPATDGIQELAILVCIGTTPVLYVLGHSTTTLTAAFSGTVETIAGSPTFSACSVLASFTDGVVCTYAYQTSSGGTNTNVLRWAAFDIALVPVQAAVTIKTDTFKPTDEVTGVSNYLALGILRTNVGTGTTQQYLIACTRYFSVGLAPAFSQTVGDNPWPLPCYFGIVIRKVTPGPLNSYGPLVGFQGMSKPFALTVNGAFTGYMLAQSTDGLRVTNATTGASAVALTNASPTLVLLNLLTDQASDTTGFQLPCAVLAPGFAGDALPGNADVAIRTDGLGATVPGWEQDAAGQTSATALACDWQDPGLWQSISLGDWTWLAGGMPIIYDGSITSEVGFVHPPPKPLAQAILDNTGPYLSKCTTLQYIAIYVWQDDNGNVHRSAPSQPSDALDCTIGGAMGASSLRVTVVPMRCTLRTNGNSTSDIGIHPVRIEIYRNSTATPGIWQLAIVAVSDPNNIGVIVVTDDQVAEPLTTQELYTTGGVVESGACPNLTGLAVHGTRVVGVAEDGATTYFTTALTRAECPRFNNTFTITWPEGPLTACWSLEQRLHAATKDSAYFIIGDGPTDTNVGVDWTTPQRWQYDLGVIDPRGVCLFQGGVMLNTRKGLYLQGRDGSMVWFGQRIQRTYAANPVVTSISSLTDDGAIRIFLQPSDGQSQSGVTIHFDYRNNKIAKHVYSHNTNTGMVSSVIADGAIYMLEANLNVSVTHTEDAGYLDGGSQWVSAPVQTGWVNVGGVMQGGGEGVLGLAMARKQGRAGIQVHSARDFGASNDVNVPTLTDTQVEALPALPIVQLRASVGTQTCESVSFTVEDTAPTSPGNYGTGQGLDLIALLVRSMPKRGEYKELANGADQ